MEKDEAGKISMTKVILQPEVKFHGGKADLKVLEEMHHEAHELCFIANSVKTEVTVKVAA